MTRVVSFLSDILFNRIINGQLLTASPGGIKYNTVVTPTNPVLNEVSSDNDGKSCDQSRDCFTT